MDVSKLKKGRIILCEGKAINSKKYIKISINSNQQQSTHSTIFIGLTIYNAFIHTLFLASYDCLCDCSHKCEKLHNGRCENTRLNHTGQFCLRLEEFRNSSCWRIELYQCKIRLFWIVYSKNND